MAIGVRISYIEDDHKFPRRVMLVEASGVSGGPSNQRIQLKKGEEVELWAGPEARIHLKDIGPDKEP